jgi:PadR family transcriptional regulator AphA
VTKRGEHRSRCPGRHHRLGFWLWTRCHHSSTLTRLTLTCQDVDVSLRHAILGLLADGPSSGYDLLRMFRQSGVGYGLPAHQSQVYGELARITKAGLAEVGQEGPRGRKEYSITEAGREELRKWLMVPAPERIVRYEPLLRAFFLWTLAPAQCEAYLTSFREEAEQFLEEFRKIEATAPWEDTGPDRGSRLALELALLIAEASATWARWALVQTELDATR